MGQSHIDHSDQHAAVHCKVVDRLRECQRRRFWHGRTNRYGGGPLRSQQSNCSSRPNFAHRGACVTTHQPTFVKHRESVGPRRTCLPISPRMQTALERITRRTITTRTDTTNMTHSAPSARCRCGSRPVRTLDVVPPDRARREPFPSAYCCDGDSPPCISESHRFQATHSVAYEFDTVLHKQRAARKSRVDFESGGHALPSTRRDLGRTRSAGMFQQHNN